MHCSASTVQTNPAPAQASVQLWEFEDRTKLIPVREHELQVGLAVGLAVGLVVGSAAIRGREVRLMKNARFNVMEMRILIVNASIRFFFLRRRCGLIENVCLKVARLVFSLCF